MGTVLFGTTNRNPLAPFRVRGFFLFRLYAKENRPQWSLAELGVHGSGGAATVTHGEDYGCTATYYVTTCKDGRY